MLTIWQIMKAVDFGRRERSEYVRITNLRHGRSKKTGLPKTVSRAYSKKDGYTSSHKYTCSVDCLDLRSHVKVHCSCPDHIFSGNEYMLMTQGAADIIGGNGEPPADPKRPGCCKHLVMTFKEMLKEGILDQKLLYKDLAKK